MSQITVLPLTGDALRAAIPDLAQLRCTVFAQWPYLYHGDPSYESDYLRDFAVAPGAVLIAALARTGDGERIVGIATASPMSGQKAEYQAQFTERGIDVSTLYYFGESVLLAEYRGQGLGHAFFDQREEQARLHGAKAATFCGVIRPVDHPAAPADYSPLDTFWRKRGYEMIPGLIANFSWKDIGDAEQSDKRMQYWLKAL
jgi:GNAT superfamily N-acetyltransferase